MLDGAFTFRGRIGRLQFFGNGLLMIPAGAVIAMVLAMAFPRDGKQLAAFVIIAVLAGLGFLWFSLSLHVRRIRDIGWDPVAVVGGWLVVNAADPVLAALVPRLALPGHHGTALGGALNLGLSLALLFWPGHEGRDLPSGGAPERLPPAAPAAPATQAGASPSRPSRARGFGRRGVASTP